jgi:hypothetical protein
MLPFGSINEMFTSSLKKKKEKKKEKQEDKLTGESIEAMGTKEYYLLCINIMAPVP